MNEIRTYKAFNSRISLKARFRSKVRDTVVSCLAAKKDISKTKDCIHFPYYHHVFDDEVMSFGRQLRYLKNYGEFISLDEACDLLAKEKPFRGRYFCLTFDDGFSNTFSNMMDITSGLDVPSFIYLPTDYMGLRTNQKDELIKIRSFHPNEPKNVTFLNWDNCREMLSNKVSFGSHTQSHAKLISLSVEKIELELKGSKEKIEKELDVPCLHLACPWGKIGVDFDSYITTSTAKDLGYKSVSSTNRGFNRYGVDLFTLKRDHVLCNWGNNQLRYLFGK
jgi:peptidoglycan/xylan/chitin deacetylase (PgdA/CDA1 family)